MSDTIHTAYIAQLQSYLTTHLIKEPGVVLEPDTSLLLGGLIDSLGIVRLVTWLEDSLGLKVPLEDVTLENFETLALLDAYLQSRPGAR